MAERTDWKGLHAALVTERDTILAANTKQAERIAELEKELGWKDGQIEDLKRQVQRARLEGARATTAALLECSE